MQSVIERQGLQIGSWLELKFTLPAVLLCLLGLPGTLPATTYDVGPGQPFTTIASLPPLNPGDIVNIHPGTYNEVRRWTDNGTPSAPITLQGVGTPRPVIDGTGQNVSGKSGTPRAIWQIEGSYYLIQNVEFKNARNGNNGAGIRVLNNNTTTVHNCKITYCDMGMMSSGNDNLTVDHSEVAYNGTSKFNGFSHNFYLAGGSTTVQYCFIHDALFGQNFKTRGHFTQLLYNYIADSNEGEVGPVDGTDTVAANSNVAMIGNIVISEPDRTGNTSKFIDFGQDSGGAHNGTLYLVNNTLIAGSPSIDFLSASATGSTITAVNNIFVGSNTIAGVGTAQVSGNNNWVPSTATIPPGFVATATGTDPGFVNATLRDYYLTASAQVRDLGASSPTFVDGSGVSHSAVPTVEYVRHLNNTPRLSDSALDLGAYENGTSLPSEPPFVSAGSDQTVTLAAGATLQGAVMDINAGGTATTLWGVLSGAGTVTFGNPAALSTTASFSTPGVYVLTLTGTDSPSGLSDFRKVMITVNRH